ncbi:MAG: hypothetical protein HY231_11040 [Acidobacteria bacterium]|nr:hypothetical protein [Acidobacteriota bacterium]
MIEENVISKAGAHHQATERMLCEAILAEGFTPRKRKADYTKLAPLAQTQSRLHQTRAPRLKRW